MGIRAIFYVAGKRQLINSDPIYMQVNWLWRISGSYLQETVLVFGQNLPTVQSYISWASNVTRN